MSETMFDQTLIHIPPVSIKLMRYQKGDYGFEIKVHAESVGEASDLIAASEKWLTSTYCRKGETAI